ncbi:MAG: hypothetical protein HYY34_01830 [Chloroflexi bacterium]|nr:hypothetical protein [Chloroflexota bacterium]
MPYRLIGRDFIYALRPGSYVWALRVDIEGRVLTHPKTLTVQVRTRGGAR